MNRTISYDQLQIPEIQYIEFDDYKIAYREMGQGEPIFMLPSWPANSIEYVPLMNLLSKSFNCIAIDLPYWTGYSTTTKRDLFVKDYQYIINKFFEKKINQKCHLMGYSFSVPFATLFKIEHQELIDKTILVSGFTNGKDLMNRYPKLLRLYKILKPFAPDPLISNIVRKILFNTYKETVYYKEYNDAPLFVEFFQMVNDLKFKKALNSILDVSNKDFTEEFLQAYKDDLPLLLWAEKDPPFIREAMAKLDDMICTDDFTVRATDHNHLAFEVIKSAQLIENFLKSQKKQIS